MICKCLRYVLLADAAVRNDQGVNSTGVTIYMLLTVLLMALGKSRLSKMFAAGNRVAAIMEAKFGIPRTAKALQSKSSVKAAGP